MSDQRVGKPLGGRRARLYVIEDCESSFWTGARWEAANLSLAARFTTLRGATETLCEIAPGTDRARFPLRVEVWRPVRAKRAGR